MEVKAQLVDNKTNKLRPLDFIFDTGAYMTVIDNNTLLRAGYNIDKGKDAKFDVVGRSGLFAKEILLRGLELGGVHDKRISLGPVLVYATDMSEINASAVLGLNVIKEFETKIKFDNGAVIEIEPTFDVNIQVRFDDFLRIGSRFGLWG
jgi:hypothetical protein